jgi:uncharacterized glyoxalase superfamily protein PhnB
VVQAGLVAAPVRVRRLSDQVLDLALAAGHWRPCVTHSVMVRVDDVDAHCEKAQAAGAQILSLPADQPFGERQYAAVDLAGHHGTFTQSIADLSPEQWGGTTVSPW